MGAASSSLTAASSAGAEVATAARAVKRVAGCMFPLLIGGATCLFILLLLGCIDLGIHKYWKGLGISVVAALLCGLGICGLTQLWHAFSFTLPLLELAGMPQRELEERLQQYDGWVEAHTPKPRPHYRHKGGSQRTQPARAPINSLAVNAEPHQILQETTSSLKEQVNKSVTRAQEQMQQTATDGQLDLQDAASQANDAVCNVQAQAQHALHQAAGDGGSYLNLLETAVRKAADVILSQIDHALLLYPLLSTLLVIGLTIAAALNQSSVPGSLIAVLTVLAVVVSTVSCVFLLCVCCCVRPLLSSTINGLLHHYILELKEVIETGERSAEGCTNTLANHMMQPLRA